MMENRIACWLIAIATLFVARTVPAQPPGNHHAPPKMHAYRAQDIDTLRQHFANPPREAGPWVYWFWFDNVVNRTEISRQLQEMADAGIAGAELRCVVGRGFPSLVPPWYGPDAWASLDHKRLEYLSPEFVEMLEHTCAEAKRCGIRLAVNLGMGWPPGGPWITDQHRSKHLQAASRIVAGPKLLSPGELTVPAGAMVFAWRIGRIGNDVIPESFCDLTEDVDAQQRVAWDVPDGRWLIGIFHYTFGGLCDKGNGQEADPGSREAVLFHLNHIFSRLEPKIAKYFGTTLVEVASDSWEYTRPRTGRYWSPGLFDAYATYTGKPLKPQMHALLGHGPDQETILQNLEASAREAVQKNFYETLASYLHTRGLRHRPQVRGRGLARDFFDAYAIADVPEIEEEVCLPEAVWTAHVLGKPIVSAEAFTFLSGHAANLSMHSAPRHGSLYDPQRLWETTPALMRQHANAHFARGINRIQIHSYSYSPPQVPPPGWRMYAEIHLNRNVPWWWAMPEFSRWVARNQLMLQSGGPVADAVVYPVRANPPDGPFNMSTDQPTSALNAVDAASESTFSKVRKRTGDVPYGFARVILLDDVCPPAAARHIADLIAEDVVLVCCQRMPENWSVFVDDPESADLSALRERFETALGQGRVIDARTNGWQAALARSQSVTWRPASASLSYQHRRVTGGEIYFLMNWGDDFDGEVSFPDGDLVPEFWDAETGASHPAGEYRHKDGRVHVRVALRYLESLFVVFVDGPDQLHAIECDNGHVEASSDGVLYAIPTGDQPCRIQLSDGRRLASATRRLAPVGSPNDWKLTASPERGVGLESAVEMQLDRLASWRDIPALHRFAGTAIYSAQFTVNERQLASDVRLQLDLGRVYDVATVWINGHRVGTAWHPPYVLEITEQVCADTNELRVEVANILKNYLERSKGYTRPSGLLGPIRIDTRIKSKLNN